MSNDEFAAALTEAMKRADLNVPKLSAKTGVSVHAIYRWQQGKYQPRGKHLQAVVEALDAPELLSGGQEQVAEEAVETLTQIIDLFMDGMSAVRAAERVVGREAITPEQRERLTHPDEAGARARLKALTPADWAELAPEEQRQFVEQIAALAQARRARKR